MKAAISLATALVGAFSLEAQITTILSPFSNGSEITIRNDSGASLVAYVVSVKKLPQSTAEREAFIVTYSDPLIEPTATPVFPGEQRVVMQMNRWPPDIPGRNRILSEPIQAAGIFSDGTTTGDAALLSQLVLRRRSLMLAVENTLEILTDAGRHNVPRAELVEEFKKMADSLDRWYLPAEQRVGRAVYQSLAEKLKALPEGQPGSPFPPSDFVAREGAPLRRVRLALADSEPALADTRETMGIMPNRQ